MSLKKHSSLQLDYIEKFPFAKLYFEKLNYRLIELYIIADRLNILAKHPKSGKVESFQIVGDVLYKLVFINTKSKRGNIKRCLTN
ncbi:hypothetical protein CIRMBP1294_01746 [Enterococcus cecorum]|nr:hypothetical protein CIRMBP1294_01746 [Enterococcus cecorum]